MARDIAATAKIDTKRGILMTFIKKNWAGTLLCLAIAAVCWLLATIEIGSFSFDIIGAPVFAILLGMAIAAVFPKLAGHDALKDGIRFTSKKVLQYAVVLLGFGLNLGQIAQVGAQSLPVILSTITVSLLTALLLYKLLKMDKKVSCLIGVGSSICGGSAIAATAPVIGADDEEVAQSISVIFLFNVLAALIFPTFGHNLLHLSADGFALFAGTAVNDTSSVTAAASTADGLYGTGSAILDGATIVKLTRTLAIIPITLVLALYRTARAKRAGGQGTKVQVTKIFPFFILFFIAASVITTAAGALGVDASVFSPLKTLSKFFIVMAMAAIGLNTDLVRLVKSGGKPILTGFCCWVMITGVSLGMQKFLELW